MTRVRLALVVLALAVVAPTAAGATRLPHVRFSGWTVTTAGGAKRHVRPGGTLRNCSKPTDLLALGRVRGAIKHQAYVDTLRHGAARRGRFVDRWAENGSFADEWGFSTGGIFRNGTWSLRLTRGGGLIGTESIHLRC